MSTSPATDAAVPVQPMPDTDALPHEVMEEAGPSIARATTILALGNVASRVFGFVREILLSNYFGPSRQMDAYLIATTIPRDLYDLAISGHSNSALVPVLSEYAAKKDREELWRLVNALLGLVLVATGTLALFIALFAPQVVMLWRGAPRTPAAIELQDINLHLKYCGFEFCAPSFSYEAYDLSIRLLQITAPALTLFAMFSILSATLFALRRFLFPAFAAAVFNGVLAVGIVVLSPRIGIYGAAFGWLLGALVQLALQAWGLRGVRLRPALTHLGQALRHPGVRRIGLLYAPVMASLVIDVLINRTFSYTLASQSGDGNISYMNWATTLREFPMGLVGTAISLAVLPSLARHALRDDLVGVFKDTLGQGIRLALTLIIPATVGMFVLAGPLIGLMFERGAFTPQDTQITAQVLRLYLLGIPFAAVDLLLIFAFYARKDSLTPALVGVFSLACYIVITLALNPYIGFFSLMVADSLKHLIHMTISLVLLRRRLKGMGRQNFPVTLGKVLLATLAMGLVTYVLTRSIHDLIPVEDLRRRLLLVIVPAAFGGLTYLLLASLLRLNELTLFIGKLRGKMRR